MAEAQEPNHQSKAAEVVVKDKLRDSDDADTADSPLQLLDRLYVYQNSQTGQVAPTARLTTRQLCRILCPPGNDDDNNNGTDSVSQTPPQSHSQRTVTPETQLLAVVETSSNNDNNNNNSMSSSYSSDGWKRAKMVPILRQATALWYYEAADADAALAASNTTTTTTTTTTSTVKGPVSCRKLAELYHYGDGEIAIDASCRITKSTRVYSEAASPTWSAIQDVAYLQFALQAFQSSSTSTAPTAASTGTAADQEEKQTEEDVASIIMAQEYYHAVEQPQQEQEPTVLTNADEKQIKDELEAFLSSTDQLGISSDAIDVEDDEAYESDNGTRYIKDARTGNWVHEALVMVQRKSRITAETATTAKSGNNKNNKKQCNAITKASPTTYTNESNNNNNNNNNNPTKKRKKTKSQFAARNAKNWIYVTGLPSTCTEEQVQDFFSQAGIIELDPETLRPKVKLYRYKESDVVVVSNSTSSINNNTDNVNNNNAVVVGQCKGDASICFARSESVDLAITLLDEAPFQPPSSSTRIPTTGNNNINNSSSSQQPLTGLVRVQRAKFERHHGDGEQEGDDHNNNINNNNSKRTKVISNAKRKVAKLAAIQARDWDDGEFNGRLTGGRKGLRIIVLKHVFSPTKYHANNDGDDDDAALARLEKALLIKCQPFGTVEKITIFASNPDGVVVVKFTQPGAASEAIKALDGKVWRQEEEEATTTTSTNSASREDVVQANFWDGVTDYTVRNEAKEQKEMEQRHDEFGQWLDNQELPEELRLKTENG